MKAYYIINPMTVSYFPKPSRRIRLLIDPITGLLATADSFKPEYREFVPGTEPKRYAPPPTMEQIENFTNEQEEQRRNLEEDSGEEDLENPEDMIELAGQNQYCHLMGNIFYLSFFNTNNSNIL